MQLRSQNRALKKKNQELQQQALGRASQGGVQEKGCRGCRGCGSSGGGEGRDRHSSVKALQCRRCRRIGV